MTRWLKGYRTILWNAAAAALGVMALVDPELFAAIVPQEYRPLVFLAFALGNAVLRFRTDTPVFRR